MLLSLGQPLIFVLSFVEHMFAVVLIGVLLTEVLVVHLKYRACERQDFRRLYALSAGALLFSVSLLVSYFSNTPSVLFDLFVSIPSGFILLYAMYYAGWNDGGVWVKIWQMFYVTLLALMVHFAIDLLDALLGSEGVTLSVIESLLKFVEVNAAFWFVVLYIRHKHQSRVKNVCIDY